MHQYLNMVSMRTFTKQNTKSVFFFTKHIVGAQHIGTLLKRLLSFTKALLSGTGTSKQPPIERKDVKTFPGTLLFLFPPFSWPAAPDSPARG